MQNHYTATCLSKVPTFQGVSLYGYYIVLKATWQFSAFYSSVLQWSEMYLGLVPIRPDYCSVVQHSAIMRSLMQRSD